MGTHKRDPRQMTERERMFYEYKMSHSMMDLDPMKDLERSMMLRIPMFLLNGPLTTREIYLDGQFYRCTNLMTKLRKLEELGFIIMEPQREHRMVTLTPEGRDLAKYLNGLMKFLRKRKR